MTFDADTLMTRTLELKVARRAQLLTSAAAATWFRVICGRENMIEC